MNSYASSIRTLIARNVLEKAIAPPATLQVFPTDWKRQVFQGGLWTPSARPYWFVGSNLVLRRIGVFCNFADGLVWASPEQRLMVEIMAIPYARPLAPLSYCTWSAVSKSLHSTVPANFNADLPVGSVIQCASGGGSQPVVGIVKAAIDNDNVSMTDYGPGMAGQAIFKLTVAPQTVKTYLVGVDVFNEFYDHEMFIPISLLGGNLTDFFIRASVLQGVGVVPVPANQPINLLTKTIDPSYAGDVAQFDVLADFEITANGAI